MLKEMRCTADRLRDAMSVLPVDRLRDVKSVLPVDRLRDVKNASPVDRLRDANECVAGGPPPGCDGMRCLRYSLGG